MSPHALDPTTPIRYHATPKPITHPPPRQAHGADPSPQGERYDHASRGDEQDTVDPTEILDDDLDDSARYSTSTPSGSAPSTAPSPPSCSPANRQPPTLCARAGAPRPRPPTISELRPKFSLVTLPTSENFGLGPTPKQLAGASGGGVDERGLMEAAIAGSSHPLVKERYQSTKRRLGRQRGAKVAQIGSQKADGGDLVDADPQTNRFSPSLRRVPFSP